MNISANFQNHWLWNDKPFSKGQAWIDLVLQSENNQTCTIFRNKVFHLNKDQIITSDTELALRWEWSRTKLRDFLSLLQDTSMIKIDRDHTKTIITILHQPEIQEINQPENEVIKQPITNQQVLDKKQVENMSNAQQNKGIQTIDEQAMIQVKKQDSIQGQSLNEGASEPISNTKQNLPYQLTIYDVIEKEKKNETK